MAHLFVAHNRIKDPAITAQFHRLITLATLVLWLCAASFLPAHAAPRPKPPKAKPAAAHARKGRATIVIDDTWQFAVDPNKVGIDANWQMSVPTSANAKDLPIPALWTSSAAPGYSGGAWYWRTFKMPADWKGQTIRIRFNAVAESARVWLNGTLLGEHAGGGTPFEFIVTSSAKIGQDNLLAVRVEGDARHGAGIWQGVEVMAHDEAYVEQQFVSADQFGRISTDVSIRNTSKSEGDATLDCRVVTISGATREVKKSNQNLHVTPNENFTNFLASVRGSDLHLWDLNNPFSYGFQLAFRQDKDVLDTDEAQFGFRSFGLKDGGITLNGEALTLSALAPHLDLPVVIAISDDTERARDMLQRAKQAGVTVLYLEAANPEMLRVADTVGMLIVESPRRWLPSGARYEEMHDLVLRDRNHPCILAWAPGQCSDQFARSLQQLDPTRFLLTGDSAKKLWAPGKTAPESGPLPAGLIPVGG